MALSIAQEYNHNHMGNNNNNNDMEPEFLAESEDLGFGVWRSMEEDGYIYHLELGNLTIHLTPEEWEELVVVIRSASS